jgi:hypothetical protein
LTPVNSYFYPNANKAYYFTLYIEQNIILVQPVEFENKIDIYDVSLDV